MKKISLLILALFISGCATTVPVTTKLPIPERPHLPPIPGSEMQCLSDEAYSALREGRKLLLNHIETLENIIGSTH